MLATRSRQLAAGSQKAPRYMYQDNPADVRAATRAILIAEHRLFELLDHLLEPTAINGLSLVAGAAARPRQEGTPPARYCRKFLPKREHPSTRGEVWDLCAAYLMGPS